MLVGFFATLLGIGGGVIHVPVMITVLQFPVHVAVATSHFVLVFTSTVGQRRPPLEWRFHGINLVRTALLAIGVIPGAQVGARLAQRFGGPAIVRFLAVALVALGIRLIYSGVM